LITALWFGSWHRRAAQSQSLETMHSTPGRRALRIIDSIFDLLYVVALNITQLSSRHEHREYVSKFFSRSVKHPSSAIFSLLPRDLSIASRLHAWSINIPSTCNAH